MPLEKKYEAFERALYRCQQKGDESHDSFLARADVMWQELLAKQLSLKDLQAYVTLRGSNLSAEDKKRVILESEASTEGKLTLVAVQKAIRMLGAGQEMISGRRGPSKLKTYDQATLVADGSDIDELDQPTFVTEVQEDDESVVDALVQEGDEDAILVADFESAALDVLQGDEDLACAYNSYADARRRLNEKVRHRGFWPISPKEKARKVDPKDLSRESSRRAMAHLDVHCRLE